MYNSWLADGGGQLEYKLLLTVLGLISLVQCLLIYKKGKITPKVNPK